MTSAVSQSFTEITRSGSRSARIRSLAIEHPVAIEVNGIGYAVFMMSPESLEDFAYGFARSERLIDSRDDILGAESVETDSGIVIRLTLSADKVGRVEDRVRHRVSETSCGLCGLESLEQALRPLPQVSSRSVVEPEVIFAACSALSGHQPLSRDTGAVHGAALCDAKGDIVIAREDVGRHNAFDKLIGAMDRAGRGWDGGFALLTSRCSYELVEKAVLADCPMLVTISAATSMAVTRAKEADLRLVTLARADSILELA